MRDSLGISNKPDLGLDALEKQRLVNVDLNSLFHNSFRSCPAFQQAMSHCGGDNEKAVSALAHRREEPSERSLDRTSAGGRWSDCLLTYDLY